MANGSSNTLPWLLAVLMTAVGAGALGFFAGDQYGSNAKKIADIDTAIKDQQEAQAKASDPNYLPPGVTREKLGAWTVICQDQADGKKGCSASQDLVNPQGQIVLSLIAGYNEQAQRAFLVRAPLGIDLGQGLEFNLPGDKPVAFEFTACDQTSCNAVLTVTDENYPKVEAAGSFELAYTRGDGLRVPASVSVSGLNDAYARLTKPTPVATPAAAPAAPAATPAATPAAPAPKPAAKPTP